MRRYVLYFVVALLAFGICSIVVFNFYFRPVEQSVTAQTIEINKSELKEQISTSILETSENEETNAEEKTAFEVLKPTIRKWLRGEKIKYEFTEVSDKTIEEISGKDKSELSEDEIRWFSYFRFEPTLIDVDGDGKNELAIRNYCAPVGNCQFWLFKKNSSDYEILLSATDNSVQIFKLRKSKTNGYFDLETKSHGDAWSGGMDFYKFDGKEYKRSGCYEYNYSYLKDGKLHQLKDARIMPRKCSE